MKIQLIAASVLFASMVSAQEATVIAVDPVYRTVYGTESVPQVVEQCHKKEPRGLIESATSGVFGSTPGAVGAGAGWIIGDVIGGSGATREIARVAGTIVGNTVGNSMSESSHRRDCEYREVYVTRDVARTVPDGYRVRVETHGNYYVVHRSFSPPIGTKISVIAQGYN